MKSRMNYNKLIIERKFTFSGGAFEFVDYEYGEGGGHI